MATFGCPDATSQQSADSSSTNASEDRPRQVPQGPLIKICHLEVKNRGRACSRLGEASITLECVLADHQCPVTVPVGTDRLLRASVREFAGSSRSALRLSPLPRPVRCRAMAA